MQPASTSNNKVTVQEIGTLSHLTKFQKIYWIEEQANVKDIDTVIDDIETNETTSESIENASTESEFSCARQLAIA